MFILKMLVLTGGMGFAYWLILHGRGEEQATDDGMKWLLICAAAGGALLLLLNMLAPLVASK